MSEREIRCGKFVLRNSCIRVQRSVVDCCHSRGARLHKKKMKPMERHLHDTAYDHYNNTIAMLNDSMGLCLPIHWIPGHWL
jgi:hypothetical protein